MDEKKSFILYDDNFITLEDLSNEEIGVVFREIINYRKGNQVELKGSLLVIFKIFKNQILRDEEKYKKVCIARSEAGKKGGRPKKANGLFDKAKKANGLFDKQSKAKKADNDNDNDNDNVSDNVSDNKDYKHIVKLWNDKANKFNLSKLITFSTKRKAKYITRTKEKSFNIENIFEKIQTNTPHLIGINDRGWKVSFDWILENDNNYVKILEDKYLKAENIKAAESVSDRMIREIMENKRDGKTEIPENTSTTEFCELVFST